ncbi:MAG: hypothetical protein V3V68_05150 [Nitrosomonadaceae bacterium]
MQTKEILERLVVSGKAVVFLGTYKDIELLVLSKIDVVEGSKYLEFDMIYTKGQDGFDVFPDKINYFGRIYTKRYWSYNRGVVVYQARLR